MEENYLHGIKRNPKNVSDMPMLLLFSFTPIFTNLIPMYVFLSTTMGNLPPTDHHIPTKFIITKTHEYPFTFISYFTHDTHQNQHPRVSIYPSLHICRDTQNKTHEYPFTHLFTCTGSLQLPTPTSSTRKYP